MNTASKIIGLGLLAFMGAVYIAPAMILLLIPAAYIGANT